MAFTHPTAQKLLITGSPNAITPPPAYGANPTVSNTIADFEDSSDEADERLTSICLKINAPLIITGDNNLIAIDPAVNASKIAMAVVSALKQMSMSASGVPMIDEEGRPRPIKVDVNAEIRVEGSKNVCGEKAVLVTVANADAAKRKGSEEGSGTKRQMDESESLEGEGKRVRTQ